MPRVRHVPMRTCLVCGQRMPKRKMLRIVRCSDGSVQIDETERISGRGCYICLEPAKIDARNIEGKIKRALKLERDVPEDLIAQLLVRAESSPPAGRLRISNAHGTITEDKTTARRSEST